MKISTAIRVFLTLMLIYFVYHETGVATVIFVAVIAVYVELNDIYLKKIKEILELLSDKEELKARVELRDYISSIKDDKK